MKKNLVRLCLGIIVLALSIFITESKSSAHENNQNNNQKLTGVHEDIQGELEVVVEDGKNNWRTLYYLKTGGKTLALHFAKQPKQNLQTGMKVRVRGVRSGNDVAADSLVTEDLGGSSSPTDLQANATALSNTTGEHKVLVILVNFQDLQTQPYTAAQAQDTAFNTVSNYYRENSYGQTWLTGDVYGWYTIPVSSTTCDTSAIATYAQQAATKAGANLSVYNHYVYAFPQTSACTFSGRASVGGAPGDVWINGWFELGVVGHEIGHNFGLYHSRSMDCGTTVIGGTCTTDEYGDSFDLMGASNSAHFNPYQKERLGWLNSGGSPPVQTITASGTYWIDAYETPSSAAKGLKVLKSTDPTTGLRTWYYLEHRTATGFDGYLANWGSQVNGVLVRTGSEANPQDTYLLDTTPATTSFMDSPLAPGQSFSDSAAGVTITTVSADGTGAWVQITVGSQPCTHANPSVSASPGQSQWLKSGTKFTYSVTVTNNESSGCSTSNFSLQGSVPAGWVAGYSAPTLSIAPGASATASFYVTSPVGTPDGMYNVNASAVNGSNSSYSGGTTAEYSIVSALGVSVSSGASTYSRSQKATVTAVVSAGGFAVSGASVTFTMTKSNGSVVTQTASTASNGTATFSYSFNKRKDPLGTYQVKAVSSANGLTGQGTTSFLVNK